MKSKSWAIWNVWIRATSGSVLDTTAAHWIRSYWNVRAVLSTRQNGHWAGRYAQFRPEPHIKLTKRKMWTWQTPILEVLFFFLVYDLIVEKFAWRVVAVSLFLCWIYLDGVVFPLGSILTRWFLHAVGKRFQASHIRGAASRRDSPCLRQSFSLCAVKDDHLVHRLCSHFSCCCCFAWRQINESDTRKDEKSKSSIPCLSFCSCVNVSSLCHFGNWCELHVIMNIGHHNEELQSTSWNGL